VCCCWTASSGKTQLHLEVSILERKIFVWVLCDWYYTWCGVHNSSKDGPIYWIDINIWRKVVSLLEVLLIEQSMDDENSIWSFKRFMWWMKRFINFKRPRLRIRSEFSSDSRIFFTCFSPLILFLVFYWDFFSNTCIISQEYNVDNFL